MRSERYQYALIALGGAATVLLGVFFYRELFPEYKIYQDDYIELEKFRSEYSGEPVPAFQPGVKQILIEREDKGNPVIDRCISCHVALQFPHFSPTKIAFDINGQPRLDAEGKPFLVPNENYIWGKLDARIASLKDPTQLAKLKQQGQTNEISKRESEAAKLESLKSAHVGEQTYDVTKVLAMHPLIGKETRPFEFHPMEEYGCSSCHSGNGRGLTTETAHGPVFDDTYEKEFMGIVPEFTEPDPENDPPFSKIFNGKPGHKLLFQTSPILVGALIQAKCVQCHRSSQMAITGAVDAAANVTGNRQKQSDAVAKGLARDESALLSLLSLDSSIDKIGVAETLKQLSQKSHDFTLPAQERESTSSQLAFLKTAPQQQAVERINKAITELIGAPSVVAEIKAKWKELTAKSGAQTLVSISSMISDERHNTGATGTIFAKLEALDLEAAVEKHISDISSSFDKAVADPSAIGAIASDIDLLTYNYQRGQQLFISQACYACHRISNLSRGGVGPELTYSGRSYPWFLKESIVWPQADLPTSTMPNYALDHDELQDLMTFLLSQVGGSTSAVSPMSYKTALQQWEAGRKLPWEKPIAASQIKDLDYAMTVFATEGCAACHRLEGFQSNVGFSIEKGSSAPKFEDLYKEKQWFKKLFPENLTGSAIVKSATEQGSEIDKRIVNGVRQKSILDKIEDSHPRMIEALYTPFKYAARAKNAEFETRIAVEIDPAKQEFLRQELKNWKSRIHRILLTYIQEYGLGRLIGPRPNWSGVYHTDQWLMEHFKNPSSHVPRSIMPVFPFDDTKFYALTNMLDVLGIRNRDSVREIWQERGFNPAIAFEIHCAQCHGDHLQGNGPVSTWIYPIPKNLRNRDFLRNLTRERATDSIIHGVKGTPMPPWGEAPEKHLGDNVPVLKRSEINRLVDWIYTSLPQHEELTSRTEQPKWHYTAQDFISELDNEGSSKDDKINEIFDVHANATSGPDKELYNFKQKFYTTENIEQGRHFFEINCAVCHGREGEGTGTRAGTMIEAKPRMLTNLDWVQSRDDLRLLRSIKYGVAGTGMTPWGDFTSAQQRMQLVMFIRSLTSERHQRTSLSEALYAAFDEADFTVEHARSDLDATIEKAETKLTALQQERQESELRDSQSPTAVSTSISVYQKELAQDAKIKELKSHDNLYSDLRARIKEERSAYQTAGDFLLLASNQQDLSDYITLLETLNKRLTFANGILTYNMTPKEEKTLADTGAAIATRIQLQLDSLENEKVILSGKIPSAEQRQALQELITRISALTDVRNRLIAALAQGIRLRQEEKKLVEEITKVSKDNSTQNGQNG
jgi:mono/diheme cytochrome c family protein